MDHTQATFSCLLTEAAAQKPLTPFRPMWVRVTVHQKLWFFLSFFRGNMHFEMPLKWFAAVQFYIIGVCSLIRSVDHKTKKAPQNAEIGFFF